MRKSLWIALMFVLALAMPVRAYANPVESFNDGLDTLLHPNTEVKVDDGLPVDYKPQEVDLYGTQETPRALPEDPTTIDYIKDWFETGMVIQVDSSYYRLSNPSHWPLFISRVFTLYPTRYAFAGAVALVFAWWGVRKSNRIIMTAFRSGSLNLGTSVKRAWYRHKAREWYG